MRSVIATGAGLALAVGCWDFAAAQRLPAGAGDVLLTFDTEFEDDAASIIALGIDVPATYFWTGVYARKHPDILRHLAEQGHTIGSHSFHHDNLTTLGERQVQLDLDLAKTVLEDIAGVPIMAFRAPYLEYTDSIMAEVERLGFLVDSSDQAPWMHNRRLPEIAISEFEELLVSDFDIFERRGLDDTTGLDFLIRAYSHHAIKGQPFVMLLHPRIIGRHPDVIHAFIDHVEKSGGRFLTLEGYLRDLDSQSGPRRIALWAELGPTSSVDALISVAEERGATDLFLSVPASATDQLRGPTLTAVAVAAIQSHGILVHLAVPVTRNPALAAALPTAVMVDALGRPSTDWVSPSHPEVRRRLVAMAAELVSELGVDGLHLYDIGYAGLAWDFSPAALQRFSAATVISGVTPEEILSLHYLTWTQWRSNEVALLVAEIADAARDERADIIVSVSLNSAAATDFRVRELVGQDFRLLGGMVDMIVPSSSLSSGQHNSSVARMLLASHAQAGSKAEVLLGKDLPEDQYFPPFVAAAAFPRLRSVFALSSGTIVDLRAGDGAKRRTIWPNLAVLLSNHSTVAPVPH